MKKFILTAAAFLCLATPASVAAHHHENPDVVATSHGGMSCAQWAAVDGWHPNAPGSYSSYNCSDGNEVDSSPGDYARVNGRARYSGTLHHVRIHAIHFNCWLGVLCDTRFDVYNHWHG